MILLDHATVKSFWQPLGESVTYVMALVQKWILLGKTGPLTPVFPANQAYTAATNSGACAHQGSRIRRSISPARHGADSSAQRGAKVFLDARLDSQRSATTAAQWSHE